MGQKKSKLTGLIIGDSQVGKSSLILRWQGKTSDDRLDPCKKSITFTAGKKTSKKVQKVELELEELPTSGILEWCSVGRVRWEYSLLVLMYDTTRAGTMQQLEEWWPVLEAVTGSHIHVVLVANKMDAEDQNEVLPRDVHALLHKIKRFNRCSTVSVDMSCTTDLQETVDDFVLQTLANLYSCQLRMKGESVQPSDFNIKVIRESRPQARERPSTVRGQDNVI